MTSLYILILSIIAAVLAVYCLWQDWVIGRLYEYIERLEREAK